MSIFYVDVIGPVNLKQNNGHYFILVAIEFHKVNGNMFLRACNFKVVKWFIERDLTC